MRQHNPRKLRQPRAKLQNYTPSSKAKICTCSEAYGFRAEQRKALRDKESLPILRKMENWFESIIHRLLPKDPLRKAVQYCMKRWAKLKAYLKDGAIEIDNNPVENQIRPVALGRKNYLFSGSHESAQHVV